MPAALAPQPSEAEFQAAVVALAEAAGWRVYHVADVRRRLRSHSAEGYPDLTLAHPRRGVIFAELKAARGRLRPAQLEWRDALREAGADWREWRPRDWPEIEAALAGAPPGG